MSVDSRNEPDGISLTWIKEQLRGLSAVEPPEGLKERLRADIPCPAEDEASASHIRWWLGATGWAGMAATIMVLGGVLWVWTPAAPPVGPEPDASRSRGLVLAVDYNNSVGQMRATDYNSLRPPDINALDSNGLQ